MIHEKVECVIDARDLNLSIALAMDTYHQLICSYLKTQLIELGSTEKRVVFNFVSGLDNLFDSIRIRNGKLSDFLSSLDT